MTAWLKDKRMPLRKKIRIKKGPYNPYIARAIIQSFNS